MTPKVLLWKLPHVSLKESNEFLNEVQSREQGRDNFSGGGHSWINRPQWKTASHKPSVLTVISGSQGSSLLTALLIHLSLIK